MQCVRSDTKLFFHFRAMRKLFLPYMVIYDKILPYKVIYAGLYSLHGNDLYALHGNYALQFTHCIGQHCTTWFGSCAAGKHVSPAETPIIL